MPSIPFSEELLQRLATDKVYFRAEDYYQRGFVQNLLSLPNGFKSRVEGTHLYTSRIFVEDEHLRWSCTCPYDWGGPCKHVVALGLVLARDFQLERLSSNARTTSLLPDAALQDVLQKLDLEDFRDFLTQQCLHFPELEENLLIFAQGTEPTSTTLEEYMLEMQARLEAGDYSVEEEDEFHYYYDDEGFESEFDEEFDSIENLLYPSFELAGKYQQQQNWQEAGKILEALLHTCASYANGALHSSFSEKTFRQQWEQSRQNEELEDVRSDCLLEMRKALHEWLDNCLHLKRIQDRKELLRRWCSLLVDDAYLWDAGDWRRVLEVLVRTRTEAAATLRFLQEQKALEQPAPHLFGALLWLYEVSGDMEAFFELSYAILEENPQFSLSVARKLHEQKQTGKALQLLRPAIEAIRQSKVEMDSSLEALLRFSLELLREDKPSEQREMRRFALQLFLECEQMDDYLQYRSLFHTQRMQQSLFRQLQEGAGKDFIRAVLEHEKQWDALLKLARQQDDSLPMLHFLEKVTKHRPKKSFALLQKTLLEVAASGNDNTIHQEVAAIAAILKKIPGQKKAYRSLMEDLKQSYPGRSRLFVLLGEE